MRKNKFMCICSDSFDYGVIEYSLKSKVEAEKIQKEMIADYPTDTIGDIESSSFLFAFSYIENIKNVNADMVSNPTELKAIGQKIIELADLWQKEKNDLILFYH